MDCLLTRWLPTTSYLVAIETIYGCQFKSNYLKNENLFADFSLSSWYLLEIYNVLKKNEPHKWIFSGVIDSKRWAYLNAKQGLLLKTFWKWMSDLGPKAPEICRKVVLTNFFIVSIKIELGKAIFNQIWDFRTAS